MAEERRRVMTIGIDKTEIPTSGEYDLSNVDIEVQRQKEKYTRKQ